jgi:uncharacterized phage-associated protein
MQFRFQPLRAAQVAGVLVRRAGGRLNYTKLLKLMHLADRKSLLETGEPITGDSVVNMKNGPVLSNVYRCINNEAPQCETWQACFRKEEYDLVWTGTDPGNSELSEYDIEILEALHKQYASYTYSRMIDVAHRLPEWVDPAPANRTSVSPEAILRAQGASPEKIRAYDDLNASMKRVEARRVIRT